MDIGGEKAIPQKRRRKVTRHGVERPYIDPTPDDEPEPVEESAHEEWLRRQKPPHHG